MYDELTKLNEEAVALGGWFAAIFDWLREFVHRGTLRTSPFAPKSIADYVGAIVIPLLTVLAEIDINAIEGVDWADVRKRVLALAGDKDHASSAFTAYYEYMTFSYGLPPRSWPRDGEGKPHLPRAQLPSRAEIADVQIFLDARTKLGRFEDQLAAVFGMASSCAMREQDWRRCTMDGVHWYRGHWYVTLDPRPGPWTERRLMRDARSSSSVAQEPMRSVVGSSAAGKKGRVPAHWSSPPLKTPSERSSRVPRST